MRVTFTIQGEAASKANSRRLVKGVGGRLISVKSPEALAFEMAAILQIPHAARVMYDRPVRVVIHLFYRTERPDLDESLVLDALQTIYTAGGMLRGKVARKGVILNDRQVREKHVFHGIDPLRPRAEIVVESL